MCKCHGVKDIKRVTDYCKSQGLRVMHELLFGYPGDHPERMKKAIDFMLEVDPYVVGVSIGIGVFSGTRIHAHCLGNPQGVYCTGERFVDPTFFVDPSFGRDRDSLLMTFDKLKDYVGAEIFRVMVPSMESITGQNNQTAGSIRIRKQLEQKKYGAGGFHYRDK